MKKFRLLALFLALTLSLTLAAPFACATGSGSAILDGMSVQAKAAILVDPDTDEILYEYNAHEKMYPASITKVMTCLLTLEAVDRGELTLEQTVTASQSLHTGIGDNASTADIKVGEEIRIIDLLYAALIPSANEACNVMAEAVSGDITSFVELMNQRAVELGMTGTHFANTHGYHDDNHYTTAYDVYLMSKQAMQHETFRTIVASLNYTMPATNMHPEERIVRSTNALISNFRVWGYLYQYATGIKTGSTNEAGYCLAASATKEDRNLISVVMGCEREPGTTGSQGFLYFSETTRLFEWGFSNFARQTMLDGTKRDIPEVAVTLGKDTNYVTLEPQGEVTALLPKDVSAEQFEYTYTRNAESVEAPVEKGQQLGTISVSFNNKIYGTLPLVASIAVERDEWLYRLDRLEKFFDQLWVKILLVVLLVLIAFLLLRRLLFRGRRNRYGSSYGGGRHSRYTGSRRRR
ncbi:D-alanyl-D-alanine carboxypeptidase family protein [uncultured Flavonifractor sp.]|uniref:D-alanyl-D-alanine carboxypeptidase family protein n=1 Tax=uncultured Flavonifractor sp. TaxID=1193534 RepID=UPI0026289623|nr:D-alanyl-D-alanine carboxypeptidase family protein [uncultured Flavonifractor sp.]